MAAVYARDLGAGGEDANGKPVFLAGARSRYVPTPDHQLSDVEQLQWKQFQLYKATMSIDRRDSAYQTLTKSDFTNFQTAQNLLGSPYPVIDNEPHVLDAIFAIRWYEHVFSAAFAVGYTYWLKSRAGIRIANINPMVQTCIKALNFFGCECVFTYRSVGRLSGSVPNEPECNYYGILEDSATLKRKAELWEKYANFKAEWCRRWDYHVYGIRPGERVSFFSACWFSPGAVRYNKKTEFPKRKNPYFLSNTPLKDFFLEGPVLLQYPKGTNYPLAKARPEVAHLYRGPDQTPSN